MEADLYVVEVEAVDEEEEEEAVDYGDELNNTKYSKG